MKRMDYFATKMIQLLYVALLFSLIQLLEYILMKGFGSIEPTVLCSDFLRFFSLQLYHGTFAFFLLVMMNGSSMTFFIYIIIHFSSWAYSLYERFSGKGVSALLPTVAGGRFSDGKADAETMLIMCIYMILFLATPYIRLKTQDIKSNG